MDATKNGFENIKKKIISDAEREAKKLMDEAEAKAKEMIDAKKEAIESYKAGEQENIKRKAKLYQDKELAQARLKAKREFLEAREKLLDELIAEFTKNFERDKLYEGFIEKTLKENKNVLGKNVTITCDTRDKETVEKLAKKTGYEAEVRTSKITGGVILEDEEGKRVNESLESIMQRKKREVRNRLASMI